MARQQETIQLNIVSSSTSEKEHFAKSHVYPKIAAGVLGAFHIILSIGLGVSLMQLDDSWRRGDGEDPSVIIFFVLAIAATGVNQIFTAFYPGSISVGCLLGLACFSAMGDIILLTQTGWGLSWWLAAAESMVIMVTFVISCRALCCRKRNKFAAIPAADLNNVNNLGARARNIAPTAAGSHQQQQQQQQLQVETSLQAPPMPLGRQASADRPPSYTCDEKSDLEAAYRQADARAQQVLGATRVMKQGQNTARAQNPRIPQPRQDGQFVVGDRMTVELPPSYDVSGRLVEAPCRKV